MPKLWTNTLEAHRREVRDAILDTTAALVAKYGLRSVTMAQIAETSGVGRATLYKYFSGVEAILMVWHERQVARHLAHLIEVRDQEEAPIEKLRAVLVGFGHIAHQHHGSELAAIGHRGEHIAHAQQQLQALLCELLTAAAVAGDVRGDIDARELANYCFHALGAANAAGSREAVERLVTIILDGLRPPVEQPV